MTKFGDQAFRSDQNNQMWKEMTYAGAQSFLRRRYTRGGHVGTLFLATPRTTDMGTVSTSENTPESRAPAAAEKILGEVGRRRVGPVAVFCLFSLIFDAVFGCAVRWGPGGGRGRAACWFVLRLRLRGCCAPGQMQQCVLQRGEFRPFCQPTIP